MFAIQPSIIGKAGFAVVALWSAFSGRAETEIEAGPPEGQLTLPVVKVVGQLPPYADFCRRQPDECDLSGDTVIDHSPDLMRKLDEASTIDDQCVGRAIRELSLVRDGALSLGLDGTEISALIDYLCRCDPP